MNMIPLVRATEPGRAQNENQCLWHRIVVFIGFTSEGLGVSLVGRQRQRG